MTWRSSADLPPADRRVASPHDNDARYANKRSLTWTGYKAHLTETCDAALPHLIIDVATTPATVQDVAVTAPIHHALAAKGVLPAVHLVDAGYVDADLLIASKADHDVDLLGPIRPDNSWQNKAGRGFDASAFRIDWENRKAVCPQGKTSVGWASGRDAWGNPRVHVTFHREACGTCPSRSLCTRAKTA
ncbi:MAG TPA: transposase, partial [Alphaproteobacteria bacterium]|nr:transposase [Alphaproteobacteria bacterium]